MKRSLPLTRMAIIGDFSPIFATILFLAIFNSLCILTKLYFWKIVISLQQFKKRKKKQENFFISHKKGINIAW